MTTHRHTSACCNDCGQHPAGSCTGCDSRRQNEARREARATRSALLKVTARRFVRIHVAEPLPVCGRIGQANYSGPYYAAGSEWLHPYSPAEWISQNVTANALRAAGFTVTVDVIER